MEIEKLLEEPIFEAVNVTIYVPGVK